MHPNRPDLLRASLTPSDRINRAPFSLQAGFISAFFGGPLAALGMAVLNAWRLGRLQRDAHWLALMSLVAIGLIWVLSVGAGDAAWLKALVRWLGPNAAAYVERLGGLLLFSGAALLHRREHRGADLFGLPRPNGWIAGIGLIVTGHVASTFVATASAAGR